MFVRSSLGKILFWLEKFECKIIVIFSFFSLWIQFYIKFDEHGHKPLFSRTVITDNLNIWPNGFHSFRWKCFQFSFFPVKNMKKNVGWNKISEVPKYWAGKVLWLLYYLHVSQSSTVHSSPFIFIIHFFSIFIVCNRGMHIAYLQPWLFRLTFDESKICFIFLRLQ